MSHGGDRSDHSEGGMLDNGQSAVARKGLAGHKFDAGSQFTKCFQFVDFVV